MSSYISNDDSNFKAAINEISAKAMNHDINLLVDKVEDAAAKKVQTGLLPSP
jgi:hypothetical protein